MITTLNKRQRKLIERQYYDEVAVREDLRDLIKDAVKRAYKQGYQNGYRAGRKY